MPRSKRHYRLTLADALSAHERALEHGGRKGIPNLSLVESAIARPYSGYYRRIEKKLAALVESVATNHGFADGNKRTSILLMHTLLTKSGYRLVANHGDGALQDAAEKMVLSVVNHEMTYEELVAWFRLRLSGPDP